MGNWMISVGGGHRVVVFIYEDRGKPIAKMIYDKLKDKSRDAPVPLKMDYFLYNIDDRLEEKKYFQIRKMFDPVKA